MYQYCYTEGIDYDVIYIHESYYEKQIEENRKLRTQLSKVQLELDDTKKTLEQYQLNEKSTKTYINEELSHPNFIKLIKSSVKDGFNEFSNTYYETMREELIDDVRKELYEEMKNDPEIYNTISQEI